MAITKDKEWGKAADEAVKERVRLNIPWDKEIKPVDKCYFGSKAHILSTTKRKEKQ